MQEIEDRIPESADADDDAPQRESVSFSLPSKYLRPLAAMIPERPKGAVFNSMLYIDVRPRFVYLLAERDTVGLIIRIMRFDKGNQRFGAKIPLASLVEAADLKRSSQIYFDLSLESTIDGSASPAFVGLASQDLWSGNYTRTMPLDWAGRIPSSTDGRCVLDDGRQVFFSTNALILVDRIWNEVKTKRSKSFDPATQIFPNGEKLALIDFGDECVLGFMTPLLLKPTTHPAPQWVLDAACES
jgi:hypothetical protein